MPIVSRTIVMLLIFELMFMSACATYVHKEEVLTFSKGVEQVNEMFELQREFLDRTGVAINRDDLLAANSPRLVIPDQCQDMIICLERFAYASAEKNHCINKLLPTTGNSIKKKGPGDNYAVLLQLAAETCTIKAINGQSIDIPLQLINQSSVMQALREYARSLAGIVDANNRENLSESVSKTCAATQKLYDIDVKINISSNEEGSNSNVITSEELLKKENESKAKAVQSICGMITDIGTGFFYGLQLKVLKKVINKSDPNVKLLADYLGRESHKIYSLILRHELENLNVSIENSIGLERDQQQYLAAVDLAVLERNKFSAILNNNPEHVYRQLAMAHDQLRKAINNPKTQLTEAIGFVERFFSKASSANAALKALHDM